jgi:hypothetical protein
MPNDLPKLSFRYHQAGAHPTLNLIAVAPAQSTIAYAFCIFLFTSALCSPERWSITLRFCRVGRWRGGHRNGDFC